MHTTLHDSTQSDLEIFFQNQLDEEAIHMAAFTPKDPSDKDAYLTKWNRLLQDPTIHIKTILYGSQIAGSVSKYETDGEAEITYWLGKEFWGKGIATEALKQFLLSEPMRPIFGRCASDNHASAKILEKCGFKKIGTDVGFANARGKKIEETIFKLG